MQAEHVLSPRSSAFLWSLILFCLKSEQSKLLPFECFSKRFFRQFSVQRKIAIFDAGNVMMWGLTWRKSKFYVEIDGLNGHLKNAVHSVLARNSSQMREI